MGLKSQKRNNKSRFLQLFVTLLIMGTITTRVNIVSVYYILTYLGALFVSSVINGDKSSLGKHFKTL